MTTFYLWKDRHDSRAVSLGVKMSGAISHPTPHYYCWASLTLEGVEDLFGVDIMERCRESDGEVIEVVGTFKLTQE